MKKIQRYVLYQIFRDVGTPILEKLMQIRLKGTFHYTKSKLSPQNIAEKAEIYFCFSNHAKIIMTDNIAYVGSSNFF